MAPQNSDRGHRGTENFNSEKPFLDALDEGALFSVLLDGQAKAIAAVAAAQAQITSAVSAALALTSDPQSRLIYCGAGTSGRVALLDGVELNPTFNWPHERMVILTAGGRESLFEAQEGAEDDRDAAARAIAEIEVGPVDVVIGLAASGTTPYVIAALEAANRLGALTIGIANNAGTPVLAAARHPILLETGPEALAGSTRLAAGTSQKIALNIFSTALMVGLGRVYRGRMVDMRVTNAKLERRAVSIVCDIVGCDADTARRALEYSGSDVKRAILIARGASPHQADTLLRDHDERLVEAERAFVSGV